MRAKEFLLEYSRAVTSNKLGAKLIEKFRKESIQSQVEFAGGTKLSDQQLVDVLLGRLETADLTRNKLYVPWMAQTYIRDANVKFEDLVSIMAESLSKYYQLTQRRVIPAPYNNINNIKTASELFQLVTQYSQNQPEKKQVDKGRSVEIYKDDQVRVIQPLDKTASCYYGQGTQWCTAATISTNRFDQFNKSGPLYVVIPKRPSYAGEKYQLHFEDNQFTNEKNRHIEIVELISKFPQLKKVFAKKATETRVMLDSILYQDLHDLTDQLNADAETFVKKNKNLLIKITIDRIHEEFPKTTDEGKLQKFLSSEFDKHFKKFVFSIEDAIIQISRLDTNNWYPIKDPIERAKKYFENDEYFNIFYTRLIIPAIKIADSTPRSVNYIPHEDLAYRIFLKYRDIFSPGTVRIFEKVVKVVNNR